MDRRACVNAIARRKAQSQKKPLPSLCETAKADAPSSETLSVYNVLHQANYDGEGMEGVSKRKTPVWDAMYNHPLAVHSYYPPEGISRYAPNAARRSKLRDIVNVPEPYLSMKIMGMRRYEEAQAQAAFKASTESSSGRSEREANEYYYPLPTHFINLKDFE